MAQMRDNFKAGLFVLLGMVLMLLVVFLLADFERFTRETHPVKVFFALSDGVQGLKPGATVTLGDQPVGEVTAITPYFDEQQDQRVVGLVVDVQVPKRVRLHWDAQIELVKPAIGSGTSLNISSVGGRNGIGLYQPGTPMPAAVVPDWALQPSDAAAPAPDRQQLGDKEILARYPGPSDAIPGALAGSTLVRDLTQQIGIQAEQRRQIQHIIANLDVITTTMRTDLPEITRSAKQVMTKVERIMDQADSSVTDVRAAIADVKETTTLVKTKAQEWSQQIEASLDNVRHATADARELVKEKRPTVSTTLDNLQQASADVKEVAASVRQKTLDQITAALDKAGAALDNLQTAAVKARDLVAGQKPVLERTLANAQLLSDQLKLTAIEVRRSPWRLLHVPSDRQLETDQLYDAARSFALAAGALDSAAQNLRAVADQQQANPQEVQQQLEYLQALFGKFQQAEQAFWKQLEANGAPGQPKAPAESK